MLAVDLDRPRDTSLPAPRFGHLRSLTDRAGLWEHARYRDVRTEHGFCTDDNARALVVVSRQTGESAGLADLAATYLGFLLEARTSGGGFHNRRNAAGAWIDDIGSDDSQGRAWWGLGMVARSGATDWMRTAGAGAFEACDTFRSDHLRANAYAALGAAEMLAADPGNTFATSLALRATTTIADAAASAAGPWPERRLTYDNARIPEALMAVGTAIQDDRLTSLGLDMLEWLVGIETLEDHFSFTPAGGADADGPRPAFDQQPIEAWAMAEASRRAWEMTADAVWATRATMAAEWLVGRNDTGSVLYDHLDGSTCDGLMQHSVNENRGAESTLAGLGALQAAAMCASAPD